MSIDTWFGAPSLTVDGVLYENIYIDTTGDYLFPALQESKTHEYPYFDKTPFDNRKGVWVGVGRLGKNLGNQACDFSADCSQYEIKYRNIAYKNVVCNGDTLLPVRVSSNHLKELSGVTFENCKLGKYSYNG